MHTHYLVYIPGTKTAKVVSHLDALPANQSSSVIFMVRDSDERRGLAVIKAVEELHNIWLVGPAAEYDTQYTIGSAGNYIRPNNNWQSDLQDILIEDQNGVLSAESTANQYYVYAYAAPIDYAQWLSNCDPLSHGYHTPTSAEVKPFYVGRGIGGRWLEHIKEAMQYVSIANVPAGAHVEYGKILKIYEHLMNTSGHACQELVRKIAIFTGEYAKEKYVAAEHFLINCYGVYQLKNLTRGDMNCDSTEFIARPKHCMGGPQWQEIVSEFSEKGVEAYTQIRKNHLIAFELNQEFPSMLTGAHAIDSKLTLFDGRQSNAFTTDGTDVFCRMQIANTSNEPVVLLDLKVSDVSPSCAINLRPIPGNEERFPQLIADAFFEGNLELALAGVKNMPRHPYFKPCAANGNGRADHWFDFTEMNATVYQVRDCPWLGRDSTWGNVSFKDVLLTIVAKFS